MLNDDVGPIVLQVKIFTLENSIAFATVLYIFLQTFTSSSASSLQVEGSNGPGFDSDFGASAGVEMRIVSSDYSSINISTFRKLKWSS